MKMHELVTRSHLQLRYADNDGKESPAGYIIFQNGPTSEVGKNGTTNEAVIAGLIARLQELNQPPYDCRENSLAITKLEEAMMWLEKRTEARTARGVEGTMQP